MSSHHLTARLLAAFVLLGLLAIACGGGGSDETTADLSDDAATETVADAGDSQSEADGSTDASEVPAEAAPPPPAPADPAEELPTFASDFDRVCTTGVGFGGASAYEAVAGTHPVLLFEEQDSGTLIKSSTTLPAGWAVEEDSNFDDNTELALTQLVACSVITARTPNGVSCDLQGDDETITLDLVDASYELSVHAATTGELIGTEVIKAETTDCPTFVFIEPGETEYLNSPTEDQYVNALRPYVSP